MDFGSIPFIIWFLPVFVLIYYLISSAQGKKAAIIVGSIFFYGVSCLSWLPYLLGLTVCAVAAAFWVRKKGKLALIISVLAFTAFLVWNKASDQLMPGVSFVIFTILALLVDTYRKPTEKSLLDLVSYILFFPKLLSGPIARLEQMETRKVRLMGEKPTRNGVNIEYGAACFIIGLGYKVLLANQLAGLWREIQTIGLPSVSTQLAWMGVIGYSLQLYFDFQGYSLMAIGIAKMLGYTMPNNFDSPYLSKSVSEFYRRWHITLGAWFRDYVFYPLSLSKFFTKVGKKGRQVLGNYIGKMLPVLIPQFIIFFLIGIWHGAEWKYIAFGFYNGTLIVLGILFEEPLRNLAEKLHINTKCFSWHLFQILRTLVLVALGKIITRAAGFSLSVSMMHSMIVNWDTDILFNGGLLQLGLDSKDLWVLVLASLVLLAVSIMQECGIKVRETLAKQNLYFRWAVYLCAVFSLIIFGVYGLNYNAADFIYRGF